MSYLYNPNYEISNSLIKKLTDASAKEQRLKSIILPINSKLDISYIANIDAVHFSTKIEGNQLTYKQVTDILHGKKLNIKHERDLKEVLNYSKARSVLFNKALKQTKLNKSLILEAHKILMKDIVTGKLCGYYRESQNVIKDSSSGKIVYLPPEAKEVNPLLENLYIWVGKSYLEEVSPYIISAIFHYYFVTIHPFIDGNGRIARLLSNYILLHQGVTLPEYASIEKQHEKNRAIYYQELRNLQAYTFYDIPNNLNITSWIHYWLDCLLLTYNEALTRCECHFISEKETLLDARLQKAISLFKKHKKLKASEYQALMGLGRTQAVDDLNKLIAEQIIIKHGGGRSQSYQII
jgi:Fic family protein